MKVGLTLMLIAPYDWEPCQGKNKKTKKIACIYLEDAFSE
jgi:hypothetical protein